MNKYCSRCGRKLIKVIVSADKISKRSYDGISAFSFNPFDKYNTETGKKQYAEYYKCSKQWFIFHDEYMQEARLLK